ncbi:hypothetical protein OAP51_02480 [Alphaproteobacteria bacterium]|nr:hypothetical protein [Alphaproteobacteria bacterium]
MAKTPVSRTIPFWGEGAYDGSNSHANTCLSADQIDRHIVLAPDIKRLLEEAMTK